MAFRVPRALVQERAEEIRRDLHIAEAVKFRRNANFSYCQARSARYVNLYLSEGDEVYLPYSYARQLFPQLSLPMNVYPRISWSTEISPFPEQVEILREVVNSLNTRGTANLNVYTGCGKTIMGVYLACHYGLLTCIVCTRTNLVEQWVSVLREKTSLAGEVWVLGKKPPPRVAIIVSMASGLSKLEKAFRQQIGMLILDEAHTFCTENLSLQLLYLWPAYILSLTATPDRPDKLDAINKAISGTTAIVRKMPKPINLIAWQTGFQPQPRNNRDGTTNWESLLEDLFSNPLRNQRIVECAQSWMAQGQKVLILTARLEHAALLEQECQKHSLPFSSYKGNDKTLEESPLLIGTVSKMGTGFDESNLCENFSGTPISVLIYCQTTRSPILAVQCVGRAVRAPRPTAIILVDSHPICTNQWRAMKRVYKKEYLRPTFYQTTEIPGPQLVPPQ